MANNEDVRFISSSVKVPSSSPLPPQAQTIDISKLPFCSLTPNLTKATESLNRFVSNFAQKNQSCVFASTSLQPEQVSSKPVKNPSFKFPFFSWFGGRKDIQQVITLQGFAVQGANALPSSFVEDLARDRYGKPVNAHCLNDVRDSINGWYREHGLFGLVSGIELLPDGTVKVKVSEAQVDKIILCFFDRETGETTSGKTRPETILKRLETKKGNVYNLFHAQKDVKKIWDMGIMEDVSIVPQLLGDTGKIDLTMNLVEGINSGFRPDIGFTTNGMCSGLSGNFEFFHKNLFGKNQKLNVAWRKGQKESDLGINHIDPAFDDNGTSRSIRIHNLRSPTIDRVFAGMEFSRPFWTMWKGTSGLNYHRTRAIGDDGNRDDMLLVKTEGEYADSGDSGRSSKLLLSMEQGLPVLRGWRCFNRVNVGARKELEFGLARLGLKLSGGHVVGDFSHEEGCLGSGPSYAVGTGEVSFPLLESIKGTLFADWGCSAGSDSSAPKVGYGYGYGIHWNSPVGPLRLECAINDKSTTKIHFGIGKPE